MAVVGRTRLEGYIEAAGLDPIGTVGTFTKSPWAPFGDRREYRAPVNDPKHPKQYDHYGKRGIYVLMRPVHGLTPAGIFRKNKPFAFQCPPMNEFGESGAYDHQDYGTISAGEHTVSIGRQLRTVQFDTLFLDWEPEWSLTHSQVEDPDQTGRYPAQKAIKDLCKIRDRGKPFHLLAHQSNWQTTLEVDYAATLRQVDWKVVAGETDAYYVTVSFKEFSTPDIQEFLVGRKHHPHLPASIVVAHIPASRKTLAKLAKFYYGDPSKWSVIASRNALKHVGPNVTLTVKNVHRTRLTIPVLTKRKK